MPRGTSCSSNWPSNSADSTITRPRPAGDGQSCPAPAGPHASRLVGVGHNLPQPDRPRPARPAGPAAPAGLTSRWRPPPSRCGPTYRWGPVRLSPRPDGHSSGRGQCPHQLHDPVGQQMVGVLHRPSASGCRWCPGPPSSRAAAGTLSPAPAADSAQTPHALCHAGSTERGTAATCSGQRAAPQSQSPGPTFQRMSKSAFALSSASLAWS